MGKASLRNMLTSEPKAAKPKESDHRKRTRFPGRIVSPEPWIANRKRHLPVLYRCQRSPAQPRPPHLRKSIPIHCPPKGAAHVPQDLPQHQTIRHS